MDDIKDFNVSNGHAFRLRIVNVNRYVYGIEIKAEDVTFGSEPPAIFKQLFLGDGSFLNSLLDKAISATKLDSTEKKGIDSSQSLLSKIDSFRKLYYSLLDDQERSNEYCYQTIKCCTDSQSTRKIFSDLANRLWELKVEFLKVQNEMAIKNKNLQFLIDANQKDVDACEKQNSKGSNKCDKLNKTLDSLSNEKKMLEIQKANLEKLGEELSKFTDEEIMKLVVFSNSFVSDHYSYITPPIYPEGDKLHLVIKISPVESSLVNKNNLYPLSDDEFPLTFFVKNKWRIFFSSGPFVALGKHLRSENFDALAQPDMDMLISDQSKYKIVSTGRSSTPIGLSAFATLGKKIDKSFGWGISTGVGLPIENKPRPFYFAGGSLSFGEKSQFNLMGGLTLSQVDKLKSELYLNINEQQYVAKPSIEYSKILRAGFFISLTYSIFDATNSNGLTSKSKR